MSCSTCAQEPAPCYTALGAPGAWRARRRREDTPMSHHIVRLTIILALGILVTPLAAEAQPPSRVPRIGFLMPSLTPERARNLEAFRHGLRELGWIEGQNVALELRYAEEGTDTE